MCLQHGLYKKKMTIRTPITLHYRIFVLIVSVPALYLHAYLTISLHKPIHTRGYKKVRALCGNFLTAIVIEMNFGGLKIGYNSNLHGKFYCSTNLLALQHGYL